MLRSFFSRDGSIIQYTDTSFTKLIDGSNFDPRVRQHSFLEIGHEIISTTILSLPLIQVYGAASKPTLSVPLLNTTREWTEGS